MEMSDGGTKGEPPKVASPKRNQEVRVQESPKKILQSLGTPRKQKSPARTPFDSPKRGPTLSTSTSSFEAVDPHDPLLNNLASTMFAKTAEWIQGELESTSEEYRLLEQMNRVTMTKYSDMRQITSNVSKGVDDLNQKYSALLPYLDQIDQIEESVLRLEQAAYKLDSYSKRLEAKYKALERRTV